jgi:3-methyladenine DNA glycosylase AlkD
MELEQVTDKFESLKNPDNVRGMAKFGINPENTYGIAMPVLRKMAKEIGKDHELALKLWNTGIHEARILAALIDIPELVSAEQMDCWVKDFDSWDVCDQCCLNLFYKTKYAYEKVREWCRKDEEYVKRAGFALIAVLAVHDKKADDTKFIDLLPLIMEGSADERNFVKKAVNWALRQIGKRNIFLRGKAIETSGQILKINTKTAKWIANDAIRELTNEKIIKRIKN